MAVQKVNIEKSPLFHRRFEEGMVIPRTMKPSVDKILKSDGFSCMSNLHVATTYFSNSDGGHIWQWGQKNASRREVPPLSVVRFRQRFPDSPLGEDSAFTLQGEGDLEFKVHHTDQDRNSKVSLHIPAEVGIETLIELSRNDKPALLSLLTDLAHTTGVHSINPLALVAHIYEGLTPLMTRSTIRETFQRSDTTKVTVDNGYSYYAYPFTTVRQPILTAPMIEDHPEATHVEVKSTNSINVAGLLENLKPFKTGDSIRPSKSLFLMREAAHKYIHSLIIEEPDFEVEAKFNVQNINAPQTPEQSMMNLYVKAISGMFPGFQVSPQFPDIERRPADEALYSVYGWEDLNGVHEALTLIEVSRNPPKYWLKYKGEPQQGEEIGTMSRTERKEILTEKPNMADILAETENNVKHPVIKIGNFQKEKIVFKLEEIDTGRLFNVSLDEVNNLDDEGKKISAVPLRQLEVEYVETWKEKISSKADPCSVKESCNKLKEALSSINEDIVLIATNLRKVEWLYQQIVKE